MTKAAKKRRGKKGLTAAQVAKMKTLIDANVGRTRKDKSRLTLAQIGKKFGVTSSFVCYVKAGKCWPDVKAG